MRGPGYRARSQASLRLDDSSSCEASLELGQGGGGGDIGLLVLTLASACFMRSPLVSLFADDGNGF